MIRAHYGESGRKMWAAFLLNRVSFVRLGIEEDSEMSFIRTIRASEWWGYKLAPLLAIATPRR